MCVVKIKAGLVRLNLAGTLHQHAGNDLEAVGDPMLKFLEQDLLLAEQIVGAFLRSAIRRHVGDGDDDTRIGRARIVEALRVQDNRQSARRDDQIIIAVDRRIPDAVAATASAAGDIPFASAQGEHIGPHDPLRSRPKAWQKEWLAANTW